MRRVILVSKAAVLGEDGLFAPGCISALIRLRRGSDLALIEDSEDPRWPQAEAILRGENIVFRHASEMYELAGSDVFVLGDDAPSELGDSIKGALSTIDPWVVGWENAASNILAPIRVGQVSRQTSETSIVARVNLDGSGISDVDTGLGFFDHMLAQVARHSGADVMIDVSGDLHVDEHHTIEDTAICLGEAFAQAIGDKSGIERYSFVLPMDDSLAQVAFDWSGRSWLVWNATFSRERIGDMPTEMFQHFFKSFADAARCNINISVEGENEHHMIESIFKAFGRCLGAASVRRSDDGRIPSTKGRL